MNNLEILVIGALLLAILGYILCVYTGEIKLPQLSGTSTITIPENIATSYKFGDDMSYNVIGRNRAVHNMLEQKLITIKQAKTLLGLPNEKKKTSQKRRRSLATRNRKSGIEKSKSKSSKRTKKAK